MNVTTYDCELCSWTLVKKHNKTWLSWRDEVVNHIESCYFKHFADVLREVIE